MTSKFRFESLLKIRETERNEKKNAFLEAQNAVQEIQAVIDQCKLELASNQETVRNQRSSTILTSDELCQQQRFHNLLLSRLQKLEHKLDSVSEQVEKKRNELDEAIKEVKILQTLKEKTEERRLEEERRRSDKEMDELATQKKMLERQKNLKPK